ncbi:MAG: hypothetical protein AMJ78_09770 [Omnitrophica WOR_2 bacterium SM23_29]|nr:MAG: hypothetical protein AMJ78_09770 [Omnitrophica WOR_2 bacterium SM23_29]
MRKTIMIIAGETSGDLHGGSLVSALKEAQPQLRLIGLGGKNMIRAGIESYRKIEDLSIVGLGEVISNLGKFKALFRLLVEKLDSEKPDCVVLIDYPEFNLRFAQEVKKRGIPLVYYISPQVWAWRKGRVKIIKMTVDKMVVVFKFEEEMYKKEGIDVEFVGHPLLDVVKPQFSKDEFIRNNRLNGEEKTVALLPGSREIEVIRNLPTMIRACSLIKKGFGEDVQFVIAKVVGVKDEIYEGILKSYDFETTIIEDCPYDCVNISDLVLVASGTATLETAILEKPMLVIYKVSFLTWLMGSVLVKIPNIGLVNIVAGERIVPEFIQFNATPQKIATEAISLLSSSEKSNEIKAKLKTVKDNLGSPQASKRTAQIILGLIR